MRNFAVGAIFAVVVTLLCAAFPNVIEAPNRALYDLLVSSASPNQASGRVMIVALDEKSLSSIGRWPWSRDRLATLLRRILSGNPKAIAMEFVFSEAQPGAEGKAADEDLAEAMSLGKVVQGNFFSFDPTDPDHPPCTPAPFPVIVTSSIEHSSIPIFKANNVNCPAAAFTGVAATGFLNAAPDRDGLLRRIPLLIEYNKRYYPSLALATYIAAVQPELTTLRIEESKSLALELDDSTHLLDTAGNMALNFRGRAGKFNRVSASDVLSGNVNSTIFDKQIVLIGATAAGLEPTIPTTANPTLPAVEAHATAIDNLLRGDEIRRPWPAMLAEVIAALISGIVAAAIVASLPLQWRMTVAAILFAGVWLSSVGLLSKTGVYVSPLLSMISIAVAIVSFAISSAQHTRRRLEESNRQIASARSFIVSVLAALTELRDLDTGEHSLRIRRYMKLLSESASAHPRFAKRLKPDYIELLVELAPIHDIGKVGIPDSILQKTAPLTPEEYEIVKGHVEKGRRIIERAAYESNWQDERVLQTALELVTAHHERWDGKGYPKRLVGDEIPLAGRLLAIVDVYDALVSRRVYKNPLSHEEARAIIVAERGTRFDPDLVEAFLLAEKAWAQVAPLLVQSVASGS